MNYTLEKKVTIILKVTEILHIEQIYTGGEFLFDHLVIYLATSLSVELILLMAIHLSPSTHRVCFTSSCACTVHFCSLSRGVR